MNPKIQDQPNIGMVRKEGREFIKTHFDQKYDDGLFKNMMMVPWLRASIALTEDSD